MSGPKDAARAYEAMSLESLEGALAMLRRQGVAKYTDIAGGGFSVEFWSPSGEMPKEAKPAKEVDVCLCGHPEHAHMNGFCVEGCDPATCQPEKAESK